MTLLLKLREEEGVLVECNVALMISFMMNLTTPYLCSRLLMGLFLEIHHAVPKNASL